MVVSTKTVVFYSQTHNLRLGGNQHGWIRAMSEPITWAWGFRMAKSLQFGQYRRRRDASEFITHTAQIPKIVRLSTHDAKTLG